MMPSDTNSLPKELRIFAEPDIFCEKKNFVNEDENEIYLLKSNSKRITET